MNSLQTKLQPLSDTRGNFGSVTVFIEVKESLGTFMTPADLRLTVGRIDGQAQVRFTYNLLLESCLKLIHYFVIDRLIVRVNNPGL